MSLPVRVRPSAEDALEEMAIWWAKNRSLEQADRWLSSFVAEIQRLTSTHSACPLAAETRDWPFELRELRFGLGKNPTHRALFTVRPDCVYVLLIRHLAQDRVSPDDL